VPDFGSFVFTSVDDGLTEEMQVSAEIVLDERSRGIFKKRHPANAYI
jgi:hypothetical protein